MAKGRIPTSHENSSAGWRSNNNLTIIVSLGEGSMFTRHPTCLGIISWAIWRLSNWSARSRTLGRRAFLTRGAIFAIFRGTNRIELSRFDAFLSPSRSKRRCNPLRFVANEGLCLRAFSKCASTAMSISGAKFLTFG